MRIELTNTGAAVLRIRVLGPQRKQPKIGDRRTTKKHGLQIRVVQTYQGMWCVRGSRYVYEWRSPETLLGTEWENLLTAQERAELPQAKPALSQLPSD